MIFSVLISLRFEIAVNMGLVFVENFLVWGFVHKMCGLLIDNLARWHAGEANMGESVLIGALHPASGMVSTLNHQGLFDWIFWISDHPHRWRLSLSFQSTNKWLPLFKRQHSFLIDTMKGLGIRRIVIRLHNIILFPLLFVRSHGIHPRVFKCISHVWGHQSVSESHRSGRCLLKSSSIMWASPQNIVLMSLFMGSWKFLSSWH